MNHENSSLNVYGRITGEGKIDARKGRILDKISVYDWKGGSYTAACIAGNNTAGFPFYKYNLPDIACQMDVYSEVEYKVMMTVTVSVLGDTKSEIELVGETGLFSIQPNASNPGYITKRINASNYKMSIDIHGEVNTNTVNISVASSSFKGSNHIFPVYNMNINIESGSVFNINSQKLQLMPRTSINVKQGGKAIVSADMIIHEEFNYFEGSMWKSAVSFPSGIYAVPALFNNEGELVLSDKINIGGNINNTGEINVGNINNSITFVVTTDNTGSLFFSKPVNLNPSPTLPFTINGEAYSG